MIRLELVADTPADLIAQVHKLFPATEVTHKWFAGVPVTGVILKDPAFVSPTGEAEATPEARAASWAARQMSAAADAAIDVVSAPTAVKPRGRPRKNAQSAEPSPIAQAAVASNTASVQADPLPPAAEGALTSAAEQNPVVATSPASAAPSLTHDLVKAKLQDVMHAAKDQNAGMAAAYEIVKKYGYTHVRDIKPEHFAAIFADAQKVLA